jgi:hypothetical protein
MSDHQYLVSLNNTDFAVIAQFATHRIAQSLYYDAMSNRPFPTMDMHVSTKRCTEQYRDVLHELGYRFQTGLYNAKTRDSIMHELTKININEDLWNEYIYPIVEKLDDAYAKGHTYQRRFR